MTENLEVEPHKYEDMNGDQCIRFRVSIKGEVIGSLYGGYLESGVVSLDCIQVNLSMRNKGIGSMMLQAFIKQMSEEGVCKIVGEMKPEFGLFYEETKRFYEKNGFQVDTDNLITRIID